VMCHYAVEEKSLRNCNSWGCSFNVLILHKCY